MVPSPKSAGLAPHSIPSLDGLRAISIVFVLLAHLSGTRGYPGFSAFEDLGAFGVRVFFVISGFLISSLLLAEIAETDSISLPRFFFRRALRLFPASYALVAFVGLLTSVGVLSLNKYDLTCALTYTMNYNDARGWNLGHLWSLAVEEQFYLLWPLILRVKGPVRAVRLLVFVIATAPLLRLCSPYLGPIIGSHGSFPLNADALAFGCLLAGKRTNLYANGMYRRLLESRWFWSIPLLTLAASYLPSTKLHWLILDSVQNAGIAITTDWVMRNGASAAGRMLNHPAISFLGRLSYSLYLWQQIFLNRNSDMLFCRFPVNVLLALGMALMSYSLVELPMLRLRSRLDKVLFRPRVRAAIGFAT